MSSSQIENDRPVCRKEFLATASAAGAALVAVIAGGTAKKVSAASRTAKGPRWAMAVDLRSCTGCKTCTVACKAENEVPLGVFRTSVHYLEQGRYPNVKRHMAPVFCNHCDNPPCVEACPVEEIKATYKRPDGIKVSYKKKATYKRPDGVVLWDNERCVGCHMCVENCPYGARYVDTSLQAGANPDSHGIGKCTYCVQRLDNGVTPSCAQTCVGGALTFGDLNDPSSKIAKLIKENRPDTWKPETGSKPATFYIGLKNKAVLGKEVRSI